MSYFVVSKADGTPAQYICVPDWQAAPQGSTEIDEITYQQAISSMNAGMWGTTVEAAQTAPK